MPLGKPNPGASRIPATSALMLALALCSPGVWAQAQPLQLWARATVPGQLTGGAFAQIRGGAAADRLVGVSSAASKSMEIHTMAMEGSTMRMRQVDSVEIPAGQLVEFKPGGMHLMFFGLKAPLQAGQTVPVTLRFERAGEVQATVQVQARGANAPSARE